MKRLAYKVALITGASRGIGRGIALCLAAEGADVLINYYSRRDAAQEVADAVTDMGQRALIWQADTADRNAVIEMFAGAVDYFGHIDIAVANAAFSIREPLIKASWEGVLRTISVTEFGTFHTCQLAAQQMVKQVRDGQSGGKIIIISSIVEEISPTNLGAYNMSKAAVNRLGRTMAAELAPYHINVNVVNPGWIDTPGERKFATEEEIQAGGKRVPWGRLGTPDDIGKAVAFLVSEDADYITGTMLRVDGGITLGKRLAQS